MADTKARIVLEAVDKTKAGIDAAKNNLGNLEATAGSLNGTIARLAPLLGAATFTAFVKNSINAADSLNDLSQRTAVSVETLAGLQLVATQSDTSLESLGKGINKLSIFMAENADRAKQLGITAKEPADAFVQLSDVLAQTEDIGVRNSIANEVLGKSYQELLPALLQGSDALRDQISLGRELNPVTTEMAVQAAEFNDRLDEIQLGATKVGLSLAEDMLPALNDIIKSMMKASQEGGLLKTVLMGLGTLGKNALFGSDSENKRLRADFGIPAEIQRLQSQLQNDINGSKPLSFIDRKKIELDIQYLAKEANNLKRELDIDQPEEKKIDKRTGDDPTVKETGSKGKKDTPDIAVEAARNYATLYGEFTKILDGTAELTKAEQALADIQAGKFADLLPWQQAQLAGLAEEVRLMQDRKIFEEGDARVTETEIELENEQLEQQKASEQQLENAEAIHDRIVEGIRLQNEELNFQLSIQGLSKAAQDEKIAARNVEIQLQKTLNELSDAGLGLSEEEIEALRAKYKEVETLDGKLKKANSTGKELGLTFASAAEDAVVNFKSLGEVIDGLGQDVIRILVRKKVTEPLANGVENLIGGFDFGNLFGGLFANANGGVYGGAGISAYSGTIVNTPTLFPFANGTGLMGEAGPEAILPLKRNASGKLGITAEGAGGGTVNNTNITINSNGQSQVQGNNNKAAELGRELEGVVRSIIMKELRPGGILA